MHNFTKKELSAVALKTKTYIELHDSYRKPLRCTFSIDRKYRYLLFIMFTKLNRN